MTNIEMISQLNIQRKICKLSAAGLPFCTTTKLKEQKIKIGKNYINYLKVGHGPHALIFTPAALGTIWTNYKTQIEHFDSSKFTLVVWDPPGYGRSYPPARDYTLNNYENDADVAYKLMKTLEMPKFSVLGWCAGGSASLILAAKYSDVVRKLVVWNTSTFTLPHEVEALRNIRDLSTWNPNLREAMMKIYGKDKLANYWAQWIDCTTTARELNMDICTKYLKHIECPTLVLYGEKDSLVDKIQATYLKQTVKNSILHVYPEGKHDMHIHDAQDFNKRVQDFLLHTNQVAN